MSRHELVLHVTAPGLPVLELPLRPGGTITATAVGWKDAWRAVWAGEAAANWFSHLLGCACSLVHMPAPPGTAG